MQSGEITMGSVRFWSVGNTLGAMREINALMDRNPPAYVVESPIVDQAGTTTFYAGNDPDPVTGLKEPFPEGLINRPQRLIVQEDAFDQDYVFQGGVFVSKRLREIFNLDPRTVQYIRPDTSGSSANVEAKDYMLMSVLAFRNAIDVERSAPFQLPSIPGPSPVRVMKDVMFREGFESDVPLFYDPNDQRLFATDAFAESVLRAGATGIAFYDYWFPRDDPNEIRVKELNG